LGDEQRSVEETQVGETFTGADQSDKSHRLNSAAPTDCADLIIAVLDTLIRNRCE
jgi:hypothetical protein